MRELLLPDLPVILWWRGDLPSSGKLFEQFLDFSDRVIVDSADLAQPFSPTAFLRRNRHAVAITDLAWGRLASWRQLTAQFFDGPALRPCLDRLTSVTIRSAATCAGGGFTPEAWLYAGWLATRLHWRLASAGEDATEGQRVILHFSEHGKTIATELRSVASGSGLISVVMQAEGAAFARFSIARQPNESVFKTRTEAPTIGTVERVVPAINEGAVELMVRELERLDRDLTYEEALFAAQQWRGAIDVMHDFDPEDRSAVSTPSARSRSTL